MTPSGMYGSDFEAVDDDDAVHQAERAGYRVLDIQDSITGDIILVIPDD